MTDIIKQTLEDARKILGVRKVPRGFSPDARWKDYEDLLPGFSALDQETAYTVYANTKSIDYKPAKKTTYKDPEKHFVESISNCFGIGFIEIETNEGVILFSKELKRSFIYETINGGREKLSAIARVLTTSIGWNTSSAISARGQLNKEQEVSYYELGLELEKEHRIARAAEYDSMDAVIERPFFVEELKTYYADREEMHRKAGASLRQTGGSDEKIGWERDSTRLCGHIHVYLHKYLELGNRKIRLAKAGPYHYEDVFQKLASTLKGKGIDVIPFQRRYSINLPSPEKKAEEVPTLSEALPKSLPQEQPEEVALPVDEAPPIEEAAEPEKLPTNLDHALRHVRRQLETQRELVQKHQDRLEDGSLQSLPNGHHAVFQKYLEVFKNLKFLKKNGIEWVGDEDGVSEEKLFSNIRKIKAEVEKNPSAIPPAGTLESYAYLQKVIDREDDPAATAPTSGSKPIELPTDQEPPAASSEPPVSPEPQKPFVGPPKPPASSPMPPVVPPSPEPPKPEPTPSEPNNPVPPTKQPPVKREWRRAKAIFRWARQNAPALVVGGLTGAGVRIAAQFALAAFVTTSPGIAAAIGSAMAIGAVAGGVSKLVTTSIWGGAKKDDKHWKRKAFLQGAAMGAVGAGIGAGVAHWLISHDYLHGWFGNETPQSSEVHGTVAPPDHTVPSPVDHGPVPSGGETPAQPVIPPHGPEVTPEHVAPTPDHAVTPPPSTDVPSHPAATAPTDTPVAHAPAPSSDGAAHTAAPSAGTEHTVPPSHSDAPPVKAPEAPTHEPTPAHEPPSAPHQDAPSAPPADTTPTVVPQGSLRDILTEEQFKKLPRGVRSLASSTNPREIALFCKEASFNLINGPNKSPGALQAGAKLIERGLEAAKAAGLDNTVTKMLHADLAYLKAWGIGTDKNVEVALVHARQAGNVMHNYGGRLLKLFGQLTNG